MGLAGLFLGFGALKAGWIAKTHTGPGIVALPIMGTLGEVVFFLGCVRNRIKVVTTAATCFWISEPLAYRRTLPICIEAASLCRKNNILITSHVDCS